MKVKKFKEHKDKYLYSHCIYDEGVYYVCDKCDSNKLIRYIKGGMTSPDYICDNCDNVVYAPKYFTPDKYEEYIENIETKKQTKKYNL